jgi:hypothetical protein
MIFDRKKILIIVKQENIMSQGHGSDHAVRP